MSVAQTSIVIDNAISPNTASLTTPSADPKRCLHCNSDTHLWFDCTALCSHCGTHDHSKNETKLGWRCKALSLDHYTPYRKQYLAAAKRAAVLSWNGTEAAPSQPDEYGDPRKVKGGRTRSNGWAMLEKIEPLSVPDDEVKADNAEGAIVCVGVKEDDSGQ